MSDAQVENGSPPTAEERVAAILKRAEAPSQDTPAQQESAEPAPVTAETSDEPSPEALSEPETAPPTDSLDDVEWEGKSYKLPPELKSALMARKDYTQKTQETAELRRSLDAQLQTIGQASKLVGQLGDYMGAIKSLDWSIANFQKQDWAKLRQDDPLEFTNKQLELRNLVDQRERVSREMQEASNRALSEMHTQKQLEWQNTQKVLSSQIKGWGPEREKALFEYGIAQGIPKERLEATTDPHSLLILDKAMRWDKAMARQTELARKIEKAPKVATPTGKPAPNNSERMKTLRENARKGGMDDAVALVRAKLFGG